MLARAAELSAAGKPFALATVVAVSRPTSARPGAHGIIHPDGHIEGWVGGSCAQPVVVKEALRSLGDGQPRLLRITPTAGSDSHRADGIIEYLMTCHSGGTLEIHVEPVLPAPQLWVVGVTPIAGALVELGAAAGFAVTLVDPVAVAEDHPAADRVHLDDDLGALDPDAHPYVVVATQGQWDEEALAAALRRDVAYAGLVASPTRAGVVRTWLAEEAGIPPERLAALRAPAGLDIGAEGPAEVALSILAELIQVRRGRAPFVASPGPATLAAVSTVGGAGAGGPGPVGATGAGAATPDATTDIVLKDPVCGMTVDRDDARHLAEHDGVVYAFCCIGCRTRFMRDPEAYAPSSSAAGT
jgi:xanthine dehydrogenase accessory factor